MVILCLWMLVVAFILFGLNVILNEFENLFDVMTWFCALMLVFTTAGLYNKSRQVEYYESIVPREKQFYVYEKEQEIKKLLEDKEWLVGDLQK